MDNYIAKFKASFRNTSQKSKNLFSSWEVVLLISPGYEYYENDKLFAIVNLINQARFSNCLVVIGDTNYRHTLELLYPKSTCDLYNKAKELGDIWLEKNISLLNKININKKITRWDEWLNHPNYQNYRQLLEHHYQSDPVLKQAFINSANEFVSRFNTNNSLVLPYDHAVKASLEYLKEECTVIMPLWSQLGITNIIYPNRMLEAMNMTYKQLVKPNAEKNLHWLTLRFKRYAMPNYA